MKILVLLLALWCLGATSHEEEYKIVIADESDKVLYIHHGTKKDADDVLGMFARPSCSDPETDVRLCRNVVWEDRYGRYQQHPALGPIGDDHPIWDAIDPYTSKSMPQRIRDQKISEDMRRKMPIKEKEMFPNSDHNSTDVPYIELITP